jgi:hypothetical protein
LKAEVLTSKLVAATPLTKEATTNFEKIDIEQNVADSAAMAKNVIKNTADKSTSTTSKNYQKQQSIVENYSQTDYTMNDLKHQKRLINEQNKVRAPRYPELPIIKADQFDSKTVANNVKNTLERNNLSISTSEIDNQSKNNRNNSDFQQNRQGPQFNLNNLSNQQKNIEFLKSTGPNIQVTSKDNVIINGQTIDGQFNKQKQNFVYNNNQQSQEQNQENVRREQQGSNSQQPTHINSQAVRRESNSAGNQNFDYNNNNYQPYNEGTQKYYDNANHDNSYNRKNNQNNANDTEFDRRNEHQSDRNADVYNTNNNDILEKIRNFNKYSEEELKEELKNHKNINFDDSDLDKKMSNLIEKNKLDNLQQKIVSKAQETYADIHRDPGFTDIKWPHKKNENKKNETTISVGTGNAKLKEKTTKQGGFKARNVELEMEVPGKLDLSLALLDKNGNRIAADKAAYFTAHYDDSGKLVEMSMPRPVKFVGRGDKAILVTKIDGQEYSLPINKGQYKKMQKEIAKNKQSTQAVAQDKVVTSKVETSLDKSRVDQMRNRLAQPTQQHTHLTNKVQSRGSPYQRH